MWRSMINIIAEILHTESNCQYKLSKDHVILFSCLLGHNIRLVTLLIANSVTFDLFNIEIQLRSKKMTVSQGHELSCLKIWRHFAEKCLRYRQYSKSAVTGCIGQGHQSSSMVFLSAMRMTLVSMQVKFRRNLTGSSWETVNRTLRKNKNNN